MMLFFISHSHLRYFLITLSQLLIRIWYQIVPKAGRFTEPKFFCCLPVFLEIHFSKLFVHSSPGPLQEKHDHEAS